jgi:hypothetical protein
MKKIPNVRNRNNRDQAFKSKQDSNSKAKTRGKIKGLYHSSNVVKAQRSGVNVGQQYRPKSTRSDKEGCDGSDPVVSRVPKDQMAGKKGPDPALSSLKATCRDTINQGTKHKAVFGPSSKTSPEVPASSSGLVPSLGKKGELSVVQNVEGQLQHSPNRSLFPVKRGVDEISQDVSDARPEKNERRYAQFTPEFKQLLAEAVEQPRQSP